MRKKWLVAVLLMLTLLAFPVSAFASAEGPTNIELQTGLNSAFTFLAVVLVFLMQGDLLYWKQVQHE